VTDTSSGFSVDHDVSRRGAAIAVEAIAVAAHDVVESERNISQFLATLTTLGARDLERWLDFSFFYGLSHKVFLLTMRFHDATSLPGRAREQTCTQWVGRNDLIITAARQRKPAFYEYSKWLRLRTKFRDAPHLQQERFAVDHCVAIALAVDNKNVRVTRRRHLSPSFDKTLENKTTTAAGIIAMPAAVVRSYALCGQAVCACRSGTSATC
jgi:hypothetical protein